MESLDKTSNMKKLKFRFVKLNLIWILSLIIILLVSLLIFRSMNDYCVKLYPTSTILKTFVIKNNLTTTQVKLLEDETTLTYDQLLIEGAKTLRNLPMPPDYIYGRVEGGPKYLNESCAPFTKIWDIHYGNIYWQVLPRNGKVSLYLYSAFLDLREKNLSGPTIRILLALEDILKTSPKETPNYFCQIWYPNREQPLIVPVSQYHYIGYVTEDVYGHSPLFRPYLLSCPLPKTERNKVPASVSLVENDPCRKATNNLRVHFDPPPKKKEDFVVCVRGLIFPTFDRSSRFIEWIEFARILGAHKIFMYMHSVHPNVTKVFKYYEDQGFLDVTQLALPGNQPNEPHIRSVYIRENGEDKVFAADKVEYTDCLYRNIHNYKYITYLDVDEMIVPQKRSTWKEMMIELEQLAPSSTGTFVFRNLLVPGNASMNPAVIQDGSKYLHMLQFNAGNFMEKGVGIKSFHKVDLALTLHNHYATNYLIINRGSYEVDENLGFLQHYKIYSMNPSYPIENVSHPLKMWRYQDQLIEKTTKAFKDLGFLK